MCRLTSPILLEVALQSINRFATDAQLQDILIGPEGQLSIIPLSLIATPGVRSQVSSEARGEIHEIFTNYLFTAFVQLQQRVATLALHEI